MSTAFLYGNDSGGTGAALTVTAPAGCTVTISKDGKTKTNVAGSDGIVVFKGLATGTWTVTITDGGQTSTKPVIITADYSTVIAFFTATIHITYPAGSTCTATDGVTNLSAPDTSGTWACIVPNAGTWTISCTDGSKTVSNVVSITMDGQSESVSLGYAKYVIENGVIDMTAHPHTVTENSSPATTATNGVTYNEKPALSMVGRNGAWCTHSFANVAVPDWATVFSVEIYHLPAYQGDPRIAIGGASLTISRGSGNYIADTTVRIDVSSISGNAGNLTFRFQGAAYNSECYIGNAWFE